MFIRITRLRDGKVRYINADYIMDISEYNPDKKHGLSNTKLVLSEQLHGKESNFYKFPHDGFVIIVKENISDVLEMVPHFRLTNHN